MKTLLYILSGLICPLALTAAPLVKDGVPLGEFVVADDAPQAAKFATDDVCDWIEKITGARVPVLSSPSEKSNEKIFVGTGFAAGFKEDLKRLAGNDGFAIRRTGDHVHVFGSRPRGTLYGMYALLENNTDLIFARPHEKFGTVYGETPDLQLLKTDIIDIPVFLNRRFGPNWPKHRATGIWLLRNRENTRDVRANYKGFLELDMIEPFGTNFATPVAKHAEAHPEYFGYDPKTDSRRFVKHGEGTMCLSVPGLPAIWAEGLAENVGKHEARFGRKVEQIRLGPGDNWFCCQCEKCVAPLTLPGGAVLECKDPDSIKDPQFRSTQIMMFVNEAMETWQELRPEIPIHFLAYIHFAEPPLVRPHAELGIFFAPYPTSNMHFPLLDPRQPEPWGRRFEKWLTLTDRLGFYEYFNAKPCPEGFYAAANLREVMKLPDHRNALIYSEMGNDSGSGGIGKGEFGWDGALMNHWVLTRLWWDPTQDVDELYTYFIERTYREAAPQMLEYYQLIRGSWLDPDNKTITACHASIPGVYKGLIVDPGLEKRCLQILTEAENAAKHPHSKEMIRRMHARYSGFSKDLARLVVAHIPEMQGEANDFDSLQWEKPSLNDDFRITSRAGEPEEAALATSVQAARDGDSLFLRFRAEDPNPGNRNQHLPVAGQERWPLGDHIEFWIFSGRDEHVFAFNSKGTTYDAKNLDRNWDSGWTLDVRETNSGWEAIAKLPLSLFNFEPGRKTGVRWFCTREVNHEGSEPQHLSYQGKPLYYRNFPIVIE